MAGAFTAYLERALLNEVFGGAAFAAPATLYVGLLAVLPGTNDPQTFTEVSGTSYARVAKTNNTTNFPTVSTGGGPSSKSNGTAVTFPTAGGTWTAAAGFGLWDASSAGNLLAFGQFGSSVTVTNGSTAEFAIGALVITLD